MPYQNTNQQLQAALLQQMQQPTSHKYGGVGKAALAAAMAIRGKREQEAAKEKRLAQAGILQSLLPFNNAPTDGVEGPPDPGAQAGQFNFQHMDAQTFANAMDNPIIANLFAQQLGLGKKEPGFTLAPGAQRHDAQGNLIAQGAPQNTSVQDALAGLTLQLNQQQLSDRRRQAAIQQSETETEQRRRANLPNALDRAFKDATPEERQQLNDVAANAPTAKEGLEAARGLYEGQQKQKKGLVFQQRAVSLLDRILTNPALKDVLGSIEGQDGFIGGLTRMFDDAESGLVSDINEARNILTAENLSIMSGVLSESDIKLIADLAGGALIRTRELPTFKKDVKALRDRLAGGLSIDDEIAALRKRQGL